ncbi:hypothetical protein PENSUB_11170 [Penicillium subrubescens]|uniref:Uncharacterized protein n=2 Tax=Penicillium subrubescens TaxID=1316194 RepID=A0A1Q5T638_9EURO|nr:hypothetical protein PENSUB_11170 [Penicillium subrubescens]
MFPFPRKSSRSASKPATQLAALSAYGSSLMSESRYDSDAHFISTPRRDLIDSPAHRARRRMELSDLIERSQEQRESERWAIGQGDDIPEPPESVYGLRFIPTPPGTIRSQRSLYPKVHHAVSFEGHQNHTMNSARSLPDMHLASQRGNGSVAGPSPVNYIRGGNDQNCSTDSQSMDMSNQKHGATSPTSLSSQLPDLVVAKKRQRTDSGVFFMDGQPVHLEDMGISHRLASQSTSSTPVSCNPSIAELIHSNRYGIFMNTSHENMPKAQRSTTSITSGHNLQAPIYHHQVGSSYYSEHPSSLLGNASPLRSPSLALNSEQYVVTVHGSKYNVAAEEANLQHARALASPAIGSKFREHCDSVISLNPHGKVESKEAPGVEAPRKVSVGWMSGGRRVGYGYSPVPDEEAAQYEQHGHGHPNPQQAPGQKAEAAMSDANLPGGHIRHNQVQKSDLVHAAGPSTPEPQSKTVNHPANTPEVNPTSLLSGGDSNQTNNEFPEPPYLRAIMEGRHSREQDCGPVVSEKRSTRSLHAAKMPPMTQSEHSHVPQSTNNMSQQSDTALQHCSRLSQSLNSNPQKPKNKRGHRTGIPDSVRQEKGQHVPSSEHTAVDIDPGYLGIEHDSNAEDAARLLRPSNPRNANWVRRLSKHQVSKRQSNAHGQEVSQLSPGLYRNFGSGSLERADSTKSIGTNVEELASMYQECLEMPGSFEGSRWASRTSRMLWDLVTTDDR